MTILRPDIGLTYSLLTAKCIHLCLLIDYSTYFKDVIQFYYWADLATEREYPLPWVPEVFLACGWNFRCWPKADTSSAVGRSHEQFARVTIKTWQKPETALEKSLAPRVECHLTTGKRAERTKLDFRCPICRTAIGQASYLTWASRRQPTFPFCW